MVSIDQTHVPAEADRPNGMLVTQCEAIEREEHVASVYGYTGTL
jgi:hypothetical protein